MGRSYQNGLFYLKDNFMKDVIVFKNDMFGSLTVIEKESEPYFIAKEIANILEYSQTNAMLKRLDNDEKANHPVWHDKTNQKRTQTIINKKGILRAIQFTRKITECKKHLLLNKIFPNEKNIILSSTKESEFFHILEKTLEPFNIYGKKQYTIDNYRIDFYIEDKKIAVEFDENNHKYYDKKSEKIRNNYIKQKLNCKFIRINDENSNLWNCGYVIKSIFNIN